MSVAEYFDKLAKHGRTAEGADATSMEALEARWRVMAEPISTEDTVLEVGCGWGGFADYIHLNVRTYWGIDVSYRQVWMAVGAGYDATCLDVLHVRRDLRYDYVVGQGLFYKQENYAVCQRILAKMWELATKAVVITTILEGQDEELSFEIPTLLAWVKEIGCTKWTLRHDYHPNDVCLYLYKE